jgi:predicted hydrocarbon binding protein
VGWYDIGVYDRVHEAIDRELGGGSVMSELGRFCAERDLTTVHRLFLRMASPSFLFSKYGAFWRRYQDSGEWSVVKEGERRVRGSLVGWGSVSESTCVRLAAYIERMLELCGAKGIRVTRPRCRSRGDACCEYLCEWSGGAATS